MKKLILILAVVLVGCSDETPKKCNCGTIANDGIDNGCHWLEVRSDCSGNKKKFCFDRDIWINSPVGSSICVENQEPW